MSVPTQRVEVIHATQPWVKLLIDALAAEGVSPNLVAGTVTMLDAEDAPTFDIVEVSDNTYRLDLGLPRGFDGIDGIQGIDGRDGQDGLPGVKGDKGDQGEVGPVGAAEIRPRGPWSNSATYVKGDVVTYGGSGYIALEPPPSSNVAPTLDPNGDDYAVQPGWAVFIAEGAKGARGADGTAATIVIGTVTATAPGTTPTVTNVGSSTAAVLNITLPRGADGAPGVKGDAGTAGTNGTNGIDGAKGDPGVAGRGITSTSINTAGRLLVTYTDGQVVDAGSVRDTNGAGRGISNAVIDASGHLILSYSDNTSQDLGRVVGADGANGAAGPGFTTAAITGGRLYLTRTNGQVVDLGQVVGAKGDKGDPGETGASGITYRGLWSAQTTYAVGDAVNYQGNAYWARIAHTNIPPGVDASGAPVITDTWAVLSLRGAKGEPGTAGKDGRQPTITVGSVGFGPTGGLPTVKNSGTNLDAQFDFTFPPPASAQRKVMTKTITGMGANVDTATSLALTPSCVIVGIKTSVPCRVRIYATAAAATRDIARPLTSYPTATAEMIMEYVTTAGNQTYAVAPGVTGASIAEPPSPNFPATVTNLINASADVTLTLTYLTLEN